MIDNIEIMKLKMDKFSEYNLYNNILGENGMNKKILLTIAW